MEQIITQTLRIEKTQERQYLTVPVDVPGDIERLDVRYRYERYAIAETDGAKTRREHCVIDLALAAPGGDFVGASGSDREHIYVSPLGSSAGFAVREITPGRWGIIAGVYHVPEEGIEVIYEITLTGKTRRLFCGDTHLHTIASDGSSDAEGIVRTALELGLDFVFLTDHNNYAQNLTHRFFEEITVLPGCEWTHYKGHAGLLGVPRPLPGAYYTETLDETRALLQTARERGAMVVLNHPFCPLVPWEWGFEVPFDAIEVWNGVMSERNEQAAYAWHGLLSQGARIPVTGGSDYHRPGLLGSVAMPCHCVYATSRSPEDIMAALRRGHGYITYRPGGPGVDVACDAQTPAGSPAALGDTVPAGTELAFRFFSLAGGDEIRLITDLGAESIACSPDTVELTISRVFPGARFVRAEIYRSIAMGLPPMKALLANPVYFE